MARRDLSELTPYQRYNYMCGQCRGIEIVRVSLAGFGITPTDLSRDSGRQILEGSLKHFQEKLQAMNGAEYAGDECRAEFMGVVDALEEWRSILD